MITIASLELFSTAAAMHADVLMTFEPENTDLLEEALVDSDKVNRAFHLHTNPVLGHAESPGIFERASAGVVRVSAAVTLGRDMTGDHVGPHG